VWIPLAIGTAFNYLSAWRVGMLEKISGARREWSIAGWAACTFIALMSTVLVIKQTPDEYSGAVLWGLALVLLELGIQNLPTRLSMFAYPVAMIATLATAAQLKNAVKSPSPQLWVPFAVAAVIACVMSARLTVSKRTQLERTFGAAA